MSMRVVPFFARALRVGSRRGRTYLMRVLILLVLLAALVYAQMSGALLGAPGLRLFGSIMYTSLLLICLAGPAYFASVITEEKEEMTLGMLRMAGVSPVSILLGKSTTQMLAAIMLLLAQVPFAVLAVTLGGVALSQIVAGYCTLVAHMVLVSNLALLCSTASARTSSAAKWTGVFLLAFFFGPLLGEAILDGLVKCGVLARGSLVSAAADGAFSWMRNASAFKRLGAIMQTGFSGSAIGFQVLSNLALGLFLFLAAWAGFDRFTREQKVIAPSRGLAATRVSALRWVGVGRAWPNALAWKDFNFMTGGKGAMLAKFLAFGALLGGLALFWYMRGEAMDLDEVGSMTMWIMLLLIFIEAVLHTSRVFGVERRWRTLSGIMVLPVSTRRLAYSKMLGCMLGLAPAVAWFVIGVALNPTGFFETLSEIFTSAAAMYVLVHLLLFLHLVAYFSLLLRHGGLVLAFGTWIIGTQFFMGAFAPLFGLALLLTGGSFEASFVILSLVLLCVTAALHFAILRRLERVAAAE